MFSAIVAIILVMTGVVLTNTLISTEEKTSRDVYSMLNNYKLADAANLARADALQSFNYNFREKLESYLTFDDYKLQNEQGFNLFAIDSTDKRFTFDSMKNNFEKVILLKGSDSNTGEQFDAAVSYVADRTVDQFLGGQYGRFDVYLSDKGSAAKQAIYEATKGAIAAQGQNFLEIVDCSENECKNGSFYFNIPLNKITDAQYEALPRIIVKDVVTQEEIKMAILPRTNLKVYIPLRFFKAIFEARKTALAIEAAHNEITSYRLGMCEASSCAPRTSPKIAVTVASWDSACPSSGFSAPVTLGVPTLGMTSYLAGDKLGAGRALKSFGAEQICNAAVGGEAFQTDDDNFVIKGDGSNGEPLLLPGDERLMPIPGCGINKLTVVANPEETHILTTGNQEWMTCSRITAVYADVVFAETNPLYIVKGTAEPGKKDYFKIRISDTSFLQPKNSLTHDPNLFQCNTNGSTCSPA